MRTLTASPQATRTVYALVSLGKPAESLPTSTDDPLWVPWTGCTPKSIQTGEIAGMVAHRAFRNYGGLPESGALDVHVYLFDPATNHSRAGKIISIDSTHYRIS